MPTSSQPLNQSKGLFPVWFSELLSLPFPIEERQRFTLREVELCLDKGVLRAATTMSSEQKQTEEVFGFKWHQRNTFESEPSLKMMEQWSNERYRHAAEWFPPRDEPYTILDAGCGAAYTGLQYFRPILDQIRYLGADISAAVDVARSRMQDANADAAFIQCDLTRLPLPQ